ncbi:MULTISPECIES: methylenetetrahydrofolate reductase [unclassified Pseudodesulfovibrio]|uniref:methylenetetrahydrofolate reductase n=1 Tax=unclassified Pseudodesulfovibrio TaxID=2661612 RepID=UPI000FEBBAEA|nr:MULTISPECIES: methylenetetrahydrofolate reductase [unclassified Pseudodesulfovibrio]MCJ2164739.1 methylenetetrahydrofolate reductase [Pseudodesulfovibrio sp. S3-i]RWU04073.1 methylenetetrahydrofolate reductase [NAD(P)H] [Pseudodesulfovibrio sp. S3]
MKIIDALQHSERFLSLEFFPPKEQAQWPGFLDQVNRLAGLDPLFVSVTYGAGGKLQDNTLEIAAAVNKRFGLTTMAHLTCVGAERDAIALYMDRLLKAGIENVLALRGDMPGGNPEAIWKDFSHASDLVEFVKKGWPEMGISIACYPDAHPEASSIEDDLKWTCHKLDAGADFAITQLFFDVRRYHDLVLRLRKRGTTQPIVPGVLPVLSLQSLNRILALCGANIPLRLYLELQEAHDRGGDTAVRQKGIEIARRQIRELLALGAPGIHLYSLNNADICLDILTDLPELDG